MGGAILELGGACLSALDFAAMNSTSQVFRIL